jgi:SIR2-like domain
MIYKENSEYKPKPNEPLVYHLYGDIDIPGSMVLTEKDYIDFVIFLNKEEFSECIATCD